MLIKKLKGFFFCAVLYSTSLFAQDTIPHFSFSGYVDAYAATYSDSLPVNAYQKYSSVSPRSNQFGLNVAMITAKYNAEKVRGVITLHFGDIPRSSWSSNYNIIQEANVGLRICKKLWLDAGFFRTHVGTEACFPKENYTSSVAVTTYFEPFYQAGARLNYNPNDKLSFYLYALNGYNVYEDNNRQKSAGVLITYIFNDKLNIGYSGYYGDDAAINSPYQFRVFNNAFLNYKGKKFKLTVGGDLFSQKHSWLGDLESSSKWGLGYGGVLIPSFQATEKFRIYGRAEFFQDPNGILSGTFIDNNKNLTGIRIWGFTLGAEYKPTSNSYIRLEGRDLMADKDQKIFYTNKKTTSNRLEAMINLGFWFE